MSILHEYSVIGHSRATIGRWLGVVAGLATSLIATLITSITALAAMKGFWEGKQIIVIPLTATFFYGLGHYLFDRWAWRSYLVHKVIGIPCINGNWSCQGETLNQDTGDVVYNWDAEIVITQKWEKIVITLKTKQSTSHSIAASLIKTEGTGYTLMYSYKNEPKIGEPELHQHIGYSEWKITEDLQTAEAFYFNSKGRITSGRMHLKRG